jgi:DNA primase
MSLLQLANELNLSPKKTASTNGGEYHSPCPVCGGKDRFIIWEKQGRYLCRQCSVKGDLIQFYRDFMGMDYRSACEKVGAPMKTSFSRSISKPSFRFTPTEANEPSVTWQKTAKDFVRVANQRLLESEEAVQLFNERGFSSETLSLFSLGWNPFDQFDPFPEWGFPSTLNEKGREKKIWLPKGLVIPTISEEKVIKIKIRRTDYKESDQSDKYIEISGSMRCPSLYGSVDSKNIVILEAELDAMLVQQYATDLCCCIAIGGAGKKPDLGSDARFKRAPLILFALDFDQAGKSAYHFWRSNYQNLRAWPISRGKSPGDALKLGVDLRQWVLAGLKHWENST